MTFEELRNSGVPTHFVERLSDDSIMVQKSEPVPIEFISRDLAFGSYLRRHPDVVPLAPVGNVRELTLKDDARDDPPISGEEAVAQSLLSEAELAESLELLGRVSGLLGSFFKSKNLRLADLKMEVGRVRTADAVSLKVIDDLGYDNLRVFSGDRLLDVEGLHSAVVFPAHGEPVEP